MLIQKNATDKKIAELLAALGLDNQHQNPAFPLPNMEKVDENAFWGWRSSYSFQAEAWCGSVQIGGEWATVIIFYVGHSHYIDGGFAVACFRRYREERVEYYQWRACDHSFTRKNIGNCLNRYTCSKCGKAFDVDSSG